MNLDPNNDLAESKENAEPQAQYLGLAPLSFPDEEVTFVGLASLEIVDASQV